ncbi:putative bifunctional diguanylate cyclase/phosphodiesterase [Chromatocurvus halotolerans]|uniref:Diguanylate cyclase/phosphodiesterase n=1 Tax=Chromatocurvus halotolerans TaxID=1132028 RepID=A0A4R2KPG1_9GAMM|nr:GGDEF domain-containing protein [Chromatocurvus halotolerans]TCO75603.1 diguanylate cyclase/phosphodiesterase [Chromatocurvus halotolerans]
MRSSFRSRLLLLIVGLLAVTVISTTLAVLRATNENVETLLGEELSVIERVFIEFLRQDREQLLERGEVLAGDFAFKRAMATGETDTMLSVLANHGQRIAADLVMLVSPQRNVIMSTHPLDALPQEAYESLDPAMSRGVGLPVVIGAGAFQLVLIPVRAPDLIGWLGLGRAIDEQALARIREITNVDVTLFFAERAAPSTQRISTLPGTLLDSARGNDAMGENVAAVASEFADNLRAAAWLSRERVMLDTADAQLVAVLSESLQQALDQYAPMRLQMVLITFTALLAAALATLLVARWVARPVYQLVKAAQKISEGDYSQRIELRAGREFDALASTLNLMQDTVAEREARIQHQAQYDLLTQLPNRNYIFFLFTRHVTESAASPRFALALLDLHSLQQVKDLYGNDFSDEVLRHVAARVSDSLRRGDMAARVADQQILLFLADMEPASVGVVMRKLRDEFANAVVVNGVPARLEFALGFVFCPQHGSDFDDLLRRAQIALSQARRSALDHAVYQLGQDEKHLRQIQVANRLPRAVEENGFTLSYQPKYDFSARAVCEVEALMRWTDEELGAVFPDEFIAIAEQTGIITRISELVVRDVVQQLVVWRESGLVLSACINLSGLDILQSSFLRGVIAVVAEAGLPPSAVVLEITETAMMADMGLATANLNDVEAAGIRLSIDDFGTGFSSLAQLKALPVQELKIDKSLVMRMDTEKDDRQIVRSTIEMAHYLGLKVVAEGVENEQVLKLLAGMACDAVQGYYLARPMSADSLEPWLRELPPHVRQIPALLDA